MLLANKLIIVLTMALHYSPQCLSTINGRYTRGIANYQVILPRKVKLNGAFHSFELPHHYSPEVHEQLRRNKRSIEEADKVHYKLWIDDTPHLVELWPNYRLSGPAMIAENRTSGRNISEIVFTEPTQHLCHYQGSIRGVNQSTVALSTCSGITGLVRIADQLYFIEPLMNEEADKSGEHLHVIYRRSLLQPGAEQHCDTRGDWWNAWAEEMFLARKRRHLGQRREANNDSESSSRHKEKRSDVRESVARYIELMVVADKKFLSHYKTINVEEYILTIMNMVANYYHDASIGNLVDVVVVRIVYLNKGDQELDLEISGNASNTLSSFCKWQQPLNTKDLTHPNHYDLAILLTRFDLCSSGNAACNLLGLAYVGSVCSPGKNCAINEDTGLPLSLTIAHEMGHNMGCSHDMLEDSGCSPILADGSTTVMAAVASKHVTGWSKCSKEYVTTLLLNQLGECLLDEPQEHSYVKEAAMLVGSVYDADQQCKFVFGNSYMKCPIGGDSKCEKLWCKKKGTKSCSSMGDPLADGTNCGKDKWCYDRKCIEIGERPKAVNGGWGEWEPWLQCSRTCGGGVRIRERLCNNPQPEHNGKYCVGLRKELEMCNTKSCPENSTNFRQSQCEEHNTKPFRGKLYRWTAYKAPESDPNPCALYCINEKNTMVKMAPRVKDGTRCCPGKKDSCVQGTCVAVGCDWKLESPAVEDVCGVCDGDGTHCKVVQDVVTKMDGAGYVEIVRIPKGAVNVKIKELKPCDNMVAIGGPAGGQYFNANYKESLSGEYKIGGVPALYAKPEIDREELFVKGPLLEDIVVYYTYFQKESPGIEYSYATQSTDQEYTPKYQWEFVDWGKCSALCGGGIQISKPSCIEERDGKVKSSLCSNGTKPEPQSRDCNTHSCKTHWKAWKWSPCSGCRYRPGERQRKVECVMENPSPDGKDGDEIIVEESRCCGNPPTKTQLCQSSKPCKNETNAENRRKRLDPRDPDLMRFLYDLNDLAPVIKKYHFKKRAVVKRKKDKSNETKSVEDHADVNHIELMTVDLHQCEGKNIMGLSESEFENFGDVFPTYTPNEDTEVLKGEEALQELKSMVSESFELNENTTAPPLCTANLNP